MPCQYTNRAKEPARNRLKNSDRHFLKYITPNKNIRKLIKHVTHKNTKLFKEFKQKYPGCEQSDSKYSDTYDKLIVEAFGGKGDDDVEKENRIIRNIAKEVKIERL